MQMAAGFRYVKGELWGDQMALRRVAERFGTPVYVYSRALIEQNYRRFDRAFGRHPHMLCYSVKANSTLGMLRLLARMGAGFDIVSGGELYRVRQAGGDPAKVVFSGVGKQAHEIDEALRAGILKFNVESEAELELLEQRAGRLKRRARASVRVNPDVAAATHPYISTGLRSHKFGVDIAEAEQIYLRARRLRHVEMAGVSCHIGSQILDTAPFLEALDRLIDLAERLREGGLSVRYMDLGGGLGVRYKPGDARPDPAKYVWQILGRVRGKGFTVLLEPGRSIVGEAGVLLTRVLYRKSNQGKNFVIVDAAMNDLLRPALYGAHHDIIPVAADRRQTIVADVVGPVCESGDFLARDRRIAAVEPGDLLAVMTVGAYGSVLGSNYNSRPRLPEILLDGKHLRVMRRRETYADLIRTERP